MLSIKYLKPINGFAKLCPLGDLHWGAKNCQQDLVKEQVSRCLKNNIYVIGMGDMIEMATKTSPGAGVYEQISPQDQIDDMIDLLMPLQEAGLLLGVLQGNHEIRASKEAGLDITKLMCRTLRTSYLGSAKNLLLMVGNQSYKVHATHGSAGGGTPEGKLKGAKRVFSYIHADLVLYGHTHGLDKVQMRYFEISKKRKKVENRIKHAVLTGSYLNYEGSYAEQKNMMPVDIGSPTILFNANQHEIKIEI